MVDIRSSQVVSPADDPGRIDLTGYEAQIAFVEGQNAMVSYASAMIREAYSSGNFALKISLFTSLHKIGYGSIRKNSGVFRSAPVFIRHSDLTPPPAGDIVELLETMCEYVNQNWKIASPYHLGAFIMWRLLYIHPFFDGNGSIARLAAFMLIQIKTNGCIRDASRFFENIIENRAEYYDALIDADNKWNEGHLDLTKLETFVDKLVV